MSVPCLNIINRHDPCSVYGLSFTPFLLSLPVHWLLVGYCVSHSWPFTVSSIFLAHTTFTLSTCPFQFLKGQHYCVILLPALTPSWPSPHIPPSSSISEFYNIFILDFYQWAAVPISDGPGLASLSTWISKRTEEANKCLFLNCHHTV